MRSDVLKIAYFWHVGGWAPISIHLVPRPTSECRTYRIQRKQANNLTAMLGMTQIHLYMQKHDLLTHQVNQILLLD